MHCLCDVRDVAYVLEAITCFAEIIVKAGLRSALRQNTFSLRFAPSADRNLNLHCAGFAFGGESERVGRTAKRELVG